MNPLIQSWLLQSFLVLLLVGSLAGLVVGALLLLRPQSLQRFSQRLNGWTSTRHLEQPLERSVNIDSWFYRYRQPVGGLILIGALYIIYFFGFRMDRGATIGALAATFRLPSALVAALLDATALTSLLGALFAVFISLFLLVRPSLMRGFEEGANRWLSLRRGMKPLEAAHTGVDGYVFSHGKPAGALIVVGSLYVLVMLTTWIGRW